MYKGIEEIFVLNIFWMNKQIDISMLEQLKNVRGRLEKPLSDQLVFVIMHIHQMLFKMHCNH